MNLKLKTITIIIISLYYIFGFSAFCVFASQSPKTCEEGGQCNLQDAFKVKNDRKDDPLDATAISAGYDIQKAKTSPDYIISTIIKAVLSFLGVIFLCLMIYGGYGWMMASGDEAKVEKSLATIKAAIIGLLIVLSAYAISIFVVSKIGGVVFNQ